jgi:hypothetical protein
MRGSAQDLPIAFEGVKADAIASRLRNDRPEKTNSKEQQSCYADEQTSTELRQDYLTPAPITERR